MSDISPIADLAQKGASLMQALDAFYEEHTGPLDQDLMPKARDMERAVCECATSIIDRFPGNSPNAIMNDILQHAAESGAAGIHFATFAHVVKNVAVGTPWGRFA